MILRVLRALKCIILGHVWVPAGPDVYCLRCHWTRDGSRGLPWWVKR